MDKYLNKKNVLVFAAILLLLLAVWSFNHFGLGAENKQTVVPKWRTYENSRLGFSLSYPDNWVLEAEDDSVVFSNPTNLSEQVTVAQDQASARDIIIKSLNLTLKKDINVDGTSGGLYSEPNNGSNKGEQVVLLTRGDKIYYLSGDSDIFEAIITSFKFLNH